MQNDGAQTKSILAFSKVALRLTVTPHNYSKWRRPRNFENKSRRFSNLFISYTNAFCEKNIYTDLTVKLISCDLIFLSLKWRFPLWLLCTGGERISKRCNLSIICVFCPEGINNQGDTKYRYVDFAYSCAARKRLSSILTPKHQIVKESNYLNEEKNQRIK